MVVWKYIFVLLKVLQLSDIVCISRDKTLYRAKIENVDIRRFLISNSKKLKESIFWNVFINRDLAYNQRREFFRRREEVRQLDTHHEDTTATSLNS